jgi:hypothetical protein
MRLDTGCEVHNLITLQAVQRLRMSDNMIIYNESICTCLNGELLISMGTLVLRWKGKRFRKIFSTVFHVIDGDTLPWDTILGAETIHEHGILKFAGFGGATHILPRKTKGMYTQRSLHSHYSKTNNWITEEKSKAAMRKREQEEKAVVNDAKVDADIRAKEEAARQSRSDMDNSNFTSSSSGHR